MQRMYQGAATDFLAMLALVNYTGVSEFVTIPVVALRSAPEIGVNNSLCSREAGVKNASNLLAITLTATTIPVTFGLLDFSDTTEITPSGSLCSSASA